eukprot:CAMPEP_0184486750 /NCGR_PEP_ID=MMETSP0113_2-20130426/8519_1 /TAXON_ID=91329 /ORGANISM="Norrisiella sphaerica, Strain BC52" /LENGTH=88 /DNA_ID=CAMNT_0026868769 /DNA_START=20 /DNA_END=286 /DNA_ORIENTATION=-
MSKFAFKALKELRIHYCQTSPASSGLREFVKANFAEMKKTNPALPIMVRECAGAAPKMTGRFDKGVEKTIGMTDMDEKSIISKLKEFS